MAETQADEARLIAEWVERLLEGGLDPTWLAAGEATAVEPEQLAILGRSARDLALVRRELEARDIPAAASLGTPDVWLSREGEMMRALLDFRCGDRRGPRAVFEKYLGRYGLDDEDAISAALSALDSPLEPLLRASNFDGFVEVVRSIEKGDDWGDDQRTFEELVQSRVIPPNPPWDPPARARPSPSWEAGPGAGCPSDLGGASLDAPPRPGTASSGACSCLPGESRRSSSGARSGTRWTCTSASAGRTTAMTGGVRRAGAVVLEARPV